MPLILDPQGQPEPLDASSESRPVSLDPVDQGRELSAREQRLVFERFFLDLLKRKGLVRHGS